MACTSLCSIGGTLILRTSPCTRIIGGSPEDKCRSDALFFTTKASSSVRSITILPDAVRSVFFFAGSSHYDNNCGEPASCESTHRSGGAGRRSRCARSDFVGGFQDTSGIADHGGARRGAACVRRELHPGST